MTLPPMTTTASNSSSAVVTAWWQRQGDCRELADVVGWNVVSVHVDNDTSAYSGKTRPAFEALLDEMKRGEIDALICWHTDRLYRSMRDLERLIEIADAARIPIKTVQGGEIDLSTSAGRMIARILGSVARQESEHMSERRVRANVQKAERGEWSTANRCFGFTLDGEPLEPEATAVRKAVADVLGRQEHSGCRTRMERGGPTHHVGRPAAPQPGGRGGEDAGRPMEQPACPQAAGQPEVCGHQDTQDGRPEDEADESR